MHELSWFSLSWFSFWRLNRGGEDPFEFADVARGIEDRCHKQGWTLHLHLGLLDAVCASSDGVGKGTTKFKAESGPTDPS